VGLTSVVLAPFASAHYLLCVGHYGGPVESLTKGAPHEVSRGGMVSVDSSMDVLQELPTLLDRDALLLHPYISLLVEVFVNEDKVLGSSMEPSRLYLIFRSVPLSRYVTPGL
jgi:hypothetical protein